MTEAKPDHAVPLPGDQTLALGRGPRQTATLALLAFAMLVVSLVVTVSVLALGALAVIERRSGDPLIPPRLLANRNLGTAVVIAFLFWATFGSVLYFLTIYFQDVHGYDALQTGVGFLLPTSIVVGAPRLGRRAG